MSALLEVNALSARYGPIRALHEVSFALEPGSVLALLGANGAGKTTTLRAICSLVRTDGAILLDGCRIERWATEDIVRRGVAHVPEGRGTFMELSTEENLRLGAYSRRDRRAVAVDLERIYNYFPRLKQRRRQQAGTLSGGEQQMLAISRALMLRPRLLLLDEPSFGLAPLVVREIFAILHTITRSERVGILLVEQNAALALELADQACVLASGRLVLAGTAETIRQDPAVRRSYLGG